MIKKLKLLTLTTLLAGLTVGFVAPNYASAAGCNSFRPAVTNDDQDGYTTNKHTVPSTSTCHDINISSITMQGRSDVSCGTFYVQFYPSSGGYQNTTPKYVCSIPGGPLKVLASNVKDGTKYRVFYDYVDGFVGIGYNFTVTD